MGESNSVHVKGFLSGEREHKKREGDGGDRLLGTNEKREAEREGEGETETVREEGGERGRDRGMEGGRERKEQTERHEENTAK